MQVPVYSHLIRIKQKWNNVWIQCILGAVSTHLHMLNQQSRKYFKRAFLSSGSVSQLWFRKKNYLKEVQECLQINKMSGDLVEYLKTANVSELSNCNYIHWALTIESSNVPGAFISNTPDEIYKSDKAPIMDAMFSFGSQVFNLLHRLDYFI